MFPVIFFLLERLKKLQKSEQYKRCTLHGTHGVHPTVHALYITQYTWCASHSTRVVHYTVHTFYITYCEAFRAHDILAVDIT